MSESRSEQGGCEPSACESCSVGSCSMAGGGAAGKQELQVEPDADQQLKNRLQKIKRKIIVMSGKGGVGKSTVAVNLAMSAMLTGQRVGLLDVDLHGPSVPLMLGLVGQRLESGEHGMLPVSLGGLKVLSVGFLLHEQDDPVIWRGPMKMGVIRQFLEEVEWGELDLLIIDVPPGTGDEPLSICQLVPDLEGAVVVTTPQQVAAADVRKSINFCREVGVPVLGVVENMGSFVCPACHTVTPILRSSGGQTMAQDMNVPFLGSIPIDPVVAELGDAGKTFVEAATDSAAARAFQGIAAKIL